MYLRLLSGAVLVLGILFFMHWRSHKLAEGATTPTLSMPDPEAVTLAPATRDMGQTVRGIHLPAQLTFAGEEVPLDDPDVAERLDRELHVNTYFHSNTIFLMKRANRWLPQIEAILVEQGLPADFKYLAVIESDLQNKVSPAQAVGFWQLVKGTAKERGLIVDRDVDERYHPLKSTEAACSYLLQAKERFGSWTNAAASYNIGQYGLDKRLEAQNVDSYYDLLLNEETSRYMLRVLAIKLIMENPAEYGFYLKDEQLYFPEPLKTVEITEDVKDLVAWAQAHGVTYKVLKRHNPWLRSTSVDARRDGQPWEVQLPASATEPIAAPDSLVSD